MSDHEQSRFVTEDRAKVIMMEGINRYEKDIGSKRHDANTRKLDRLQWMVGIGLGILLTIQSLSAMGFLHLH